LIVVAKSDLIIFSIFEIRTHKPRKVRNPRAGESGMVPENKVVSFMPGK
jgi:nucleoid DNA-binding protein